VRAHVAWLNYPELLSEAWQAHLAPREPDAPTVVSTFAGCGGSSLGYSMAGYRELLAVEWDANACEHLRANFPKLDVWQGDVAQLRVDEVLERCGLASGELDVFDGSPPCQGFSTAGRRAIDDPRNQLFREFVRLLAGLQPRVFVMENVSGMVKGKMKLLFAEILAELKACGYRVSVRLLDAAYFEVPQRRQRLIFIGVREDLEAEPSHPGAEQRPITVREAFMDVRPAVMAPVARGQGFVFPYIRAGQSAYRAVPRQVLAHFAPRLTNPDPHSYVASGSALRRLVPGRPSPTITKTFILHGQTPLHPTEHRWLAAEELSRLASFPDEYEWSGSYIERHARIGNCVPPLFMRAVATHVRREILEAVA
jgi:DNA (cytosine-5)-methyltransferase 1